MIEIQLEHKKDSKKEKNFERWLQRVMQNKKDGEKKRKRHSIRVIERDIKEGGEKGRGGGIEMRRVMQEERDRERERERSFFQPSLLFLSLPLSISLCLIFYL